MGIKLRTTPGLTDLYVLFQGTSVAVAMTEGTGLDAGWYTASDAAIAAQSLPAGTYDGAILRGDWEAPDATDPEEGTFEGFVWNGSAEVPVTTGGGPIEHTPVPNARIIYANSRGDGTFEVIGRIRMQPGETLWWAVELVGTQLSGGDLVDSMSTPTVSGAQSANMTISGYGVLETRVKFKCVLDAAALTTDTINVELNIAPESSEVLLITVPVTVLG